MPLLPLKKKAGKGGSDTGLMGGSNPTSAAVDNRHCRITHVII